MRAIAAVALSLVLLGAAEVRAQGLTLPPSGDNQRASVTQQIGPVTVSIAYSSPRVIRNGEDRKGKIWGALVPYGLSDLGFNCKQCPWRAGANENTVFTTSHGVKVQGQALVAGTYGVHMIPGKDEWTVIFSRNSTSWGSYFYDPKEDALRVNAAPAKAEYHEWLTYEFTEREPARATLALKWEELQLPLSIVVENAQALYVAALREELRGKAGFDWHNRKAAADYTLSSKTSLSEGLEWAQRATNPALGGEENFGTLMTLARAQAANGKEADAAKTQEKALADPSAKPLDIHQAGRALQAEGKNKEALKIFQLNAKRFPNQWPVHVGLMRGYVGVGDNKRALEEARLGAAQAPDEANKKNLERLAKLLAEGKKID
jgi:hypothetical protein